MNSTSIDIYNRNKNLGQVNKTKPLCIFECLYYRMTMKFDSLINELVHNFF
jgi:hypothetical protein